MRRQFNARLRALMGVLAACALVVIVPVPVASASSPGLVKDIKVNGSSSPAELTAVGNSVFFSASDGIHGRELWKSDGTAAGTKMVKNIRAGAKGSRPQHLTAVGSTLLFTAVDGVHGRELWKSDGTAGGTVLVKDVVPEPPGKFGSDSLNVDQPMVAIGNKVYFLHETCCVGLSELYVSDGTAAGTRLLLGSDDNLNVPYWSTAAAYGGKLYFVGRDSDGKDRLWVSNGTKAGTELLGWSPAVDEMYIVPVTGQSMYFSTVRALPDADPVFRLWKTNGTAAGTKPLTSAGELGQAASEAAYMAGRLYFNAGALWKSNGSVAGTNPFYDQPAYFLTVAGDQLYFSSGLSGQGLYLWVSDGTSAGTKPIVGFPFWQWPRQLVAVGDDVCFKVENFDAGWWQLWESDGTSDGTYEVASFVNPGATPADASMGAVVGQRLFFAADDGDHGAELWSYVP